MKAIIFSFILLNISLANAADTRVRIACTHTNNSDEEVGSVVIIDQIQTEAVDNSGKPVVIDGSDFMNEEVSGYHTPSLTASVKVYENERLGPKPTPLVVQKILDDQSNLPSVDLEGVLYRISNRIGFDHVKSQGKYLTVNLDGIDFENKEESIVGVYRDDNADGTNDFRGLRCMFPYPVPVNGVQPSPATAEGTSPSAT